MSLCADVWSGLLELQSDLVTGYPRTRFPLAAPAGPGEVVVKTNGEDAQGWTLDRAEQELVVNDWAMPAAGTSIHVEYPAASECDPQP